MPQVPLNRDQFHNIIQDTYGEKAYRGQYDATVPIANLIYAAFALPGSDESQPVWQLKQLTYDGSNLIRVDWPQLNGKADTSYSFSWTDRASYTYS